MDKPLVFRKHVCAPLIACVFASLFVFASCGKEPRDEATDHPDEHGTKEEIMVHLDWHKVLHAGLRVESVAKRSVSIPLSLSGKVTLNERKTAHISARLAGRVEKVTAFTNDHVRADDVLVQLYSPEFLGMQSEFLQAAQRASRSAQSGSDEHSTAIALYQSASRKLSVIGVTEKELSELEATRTPKSFFDVHAPFGGVILESKVRLGESVQAGTELFELADLGTLWVLADIYENDLPNVRAGMKAAIEVGAYPASWTGTVTSIYSVVDEKTRTVKARIEVKNTDGKLKPEMFCRVKIQTRLGAETIKIPASALLGETEKHFVFVAVNDTTFEKRDVRTGVETRDFAEILDGIIEGESIVVKGGFFLKSELAKETFGEEH